MALNIGFGMPLYDSFQYRIRGVKAFPRNTETFNETLHGDMQHILR
jgi:hypothetical protein